MKASYILGRTILGQSEILAPFPPHSQAFFCATCGDIWARIFVDGSPWIVNNVACSKHAPTGSYNWTIPGSLLNGLVHKNLMGCLEWPRALEYLPDPVLQYEAQVHLNYAFQEPSPHDIAIHR